MKAWVIKDPLLGYWNSAGDNFYNLNNAELFGIRRFAKMEMKEKSDFMDKGCKPVKVEIKEI